MVTAAAKKVGGSFAKVATAASKKMGGSFDKVATTSAKKAGGYFAKVATATAKKLRGSFAKVAKTLKSEYNNKTKTKKGQTAIQHTRCCKTELSRASWREIPFKPNDPKYIGSYQAAVTEVIQNMAKEDLAAVEEIAEDWSIQGAPAEVKLK